MSSASHDPDVARPAGTVALVAVVVVMLAAGLGGAAAPLALGDPGAFVRWGLPVATALSILVSCATLGLLVVATFLTPERRDTTRRLRATRLAGYLALAWAALTLLVLVLTMSSLAGTPLTAPGFGAQLVEFTWQLETTRVQLICLVLALLVAAGALFGRHRAVWAWSALAALVAIVLPALTGHAAGSASHEDAVNALGVHLLGVSVWVGGLLSLLVMRRTLGRDLGVTVARYSVLAAWCYAFVALTGLQQAVIRIGSFGGLTTAYGAMVLAKAAILAVLGYAGWRQRVNLAARLSSDPADGRAFGRLALTEVVLMAAATGLSAVLSRSIPPVPDALPNPSVVLDLTGFPDPGSLDWSSDVWLTRWRISWLFLGVAVVAVGLYLAAVIRLRRRGDAWPMGRTVAWVCGWLLWVYATSGAPDIWGRVLMSAHMLMHMVVAMIVPLLLVPGAPITLALRALKARTDKTWGPRELLLHVVHSRLMVWFANPVVAAALFFFSLAIFYWTFPFELALTTHTGHLVMMAHFMVTGYLFVWVLVGIDPGPPRWSPPMLLVILFATISFHAFFGVILTGSDYLLAEGFFTQLRLPWGPDLLSDQHLAGQIAWGIGEAPTLILAVLVARNWIRSDAKETIRKDRQADRDNDAELASYNAYLANIRKHDEETHQR